MRQRGHSQITTSYIYNWSVWSAVKTSFWQGADNIPSVSGTRIILASWLVVSFIVLSVYSSNIRAFLNFRVTEKPLNTIKEALDAGVEILFSTSHPLAAFLKETPFETYRRAYEENIESNEKPISFNEYFTKVKEGNVFISEAQWLIYAILKRETRQDTCSFHLSSERMKPEYICFGLSKGSPLEVPLSEGIERLKEGGLIQFWQNRFLYFTSRSSPCNPNDMRKPKGTCSSRCL
ncbi:glutamate receptor-like [Tachypleus tridentatus]|uniref:glutamate receptor-like n=1 Tax=Tachypleus tridentatus TaxID=6853 RepID=UPI003FD2C1E2